MKFKNKKDKNIYIPNLLEFLIEEYKFKPHKNTKNEYFYITVTKEFSVLYSPLTQQMIIQPKDETLVPAERFVEDLLWRFFLNNGIKMDYLWVELYSPRSSIGKKVLYKGLRLDEYALVSNYHEQVDKFKSRPWLKKACFMAHMLESFPR